MPITLGYPLMSPDLNKASRIFLASISSSDISLPPLLRSCRASSKTRGTASDRLLALNATAATINHGFRRAERTSLYKMVIHRNFIDTSGLRTHLATLHSTEDRETKTSGSSEMSMKRETNETMPWSQSRCYGATKKTTGVTHVGYLRVILVCFLFRYIITSQILGKLYLDIK